MSLCLLDTPIFTQTLLEDTPFLVLYRWWLNAVSLLRLHSLLFVFPAWWMVCCVSSEFKLKNKFRLLVTKFLCPETGFKNLPNFKKPSFTLDMMSWQSFDSSEEHNEWKRQLHFTASSLNAELPLSGHWCCFCNKLLLLVRFSESTCFNF